LEAQRQHKKGVRLPSNMKHLFDNETEQFWCACVWKGMRNHKVRCRTCLGLSGSHLIIPLAESPAHATTARADWPAFTPLWLGLSHYYKLNEVSARGYVLMI
jgi:hypothetical protein